MHRSELKSRGIRGSLISKQRLGQKSILSIIFGLSEADAVAEWPLLR